LNNKKILEYGSLFTGVGGLDLGFEQAGFEVKFQVENERNCVTILNKHWPDVPKNEVRPCMGLVGGDPCPIRSNASAMHGTNKPDMSGYFLAMVRRCKPRWVLRENVPAPDVVDFQCGLEAMSYTTVVCEVNSAAFTGQSRRREFVAGFDSQETLDRFIRACHDAESDQRYCPSGRNAEKALLCLNTRRFRMDCRENYVYEGPERGLRVLSHDERGSLQGFPAGWTDGIPSSARERAIGNAVTVPVAKWIAERIKKAVMKK
jgi:DNA (cytosine-5)-methyltransferase 1